MANRRSGIIFFKVDGETHDAKGSFTYNLGKPKREMMAGADRVHGFKELVQIPFIEGEITDKTEFDLSKFVQIEDATITLELNNDKTIVLKNAAYTGDGDVGTEDGNIQVRFEGIEADEV